MRTNFATAIAVTCIALAGPASAELSGYGEFGGTVGASNTAISAGVCRVSTPSQWSCPNPTPGNGDTTTEALMFSNIHVATMLNERWQVQLDAEASRGIGTDGTGGRADGDNNLLKYGLGFHLDMLTDTYRLGGFVSAGGSDWNWIQNRLATIGLEGEWFVGNTSVFSQYAFSHAIGGDFSSIGLYSMFLSGGARHFVHDNLMFEATFGAGFAESRNFAASYGPWNSRSGNQNGTALRWGLKGEYRFDDSPFSILAGYRGTYGTWMRQTQLWALCSDGFHGLAFDYPYRRTDHMFQVSLRFYLDEPTLLASDRKGAAGTDSNPWYGTDPIVEPFVGRGFMDLTLAVACPR